ncbi:MAG: hypothetical protein HRU15_18950, partial [Planctomycetes bacterium]|nr:hypothetical protein [Planctomycetota bacterium]
MTIDAGAELPRTELSYAPYAMSSKFADNAAAMGAATEATINANTAKVSNATHTGEITGSGVLTADPTLISNKTLVTAAPSDMVLIEDATDGLLKRVDANDFLSGAGLGDVVGPTGAGDHSLARYDSTTGKLIEDSPVIVDDSGNMSGLGNITLSGTVDGIDIATDVAANTVKVGNASHTGEMTGSGALTADPSIINNRALVTAAGTDMVLVRDATDGLLKRVVVSDFLSAGSGDVVGPAAATDHAVARYDTVTGKLIQDSGITIDDSDNLDGVTNITLSGTVDGIDVSTDVAANTAKATNATHTGEMIGSSSLTAQPEIISNRPTVTAATGDLILIHDATDSTLKNINVSDLLGGDVDGPGTATDNALARYDTATGKLIQNSTVTLDDSANVAGLNNISLTGTVDGIDVATDVTANNAKVSNATHTGEMIGSAGLTAQPEIIANRSLVTAAAGDLILVHDATDSNLKKINVGDLLGGDVDGPATATDNALARYDTATGKLIQNSTATLDDSANLGGINNITLTGTVDGIDIATDVTANTAKVSNVTHTDEIAGSVALTAQPAIISNRTTVTAVAGDLLLIQDATDGALKKVNVSDVLGGDVDGPSGATDHAVARFDTATGKLIQDSGVSIDDSANVSGINNLFLTGTVDGIDIATDVAANTAKTTNSTHTGEMTGAGALTAQPSVIGNRTSVTAAAGDMILIQDASDSNLLKKIDAGDFLATAGDVVGPATATDNAIPRYDTTTGKLVQNSTIIIDDSANLSGIANITLTGTVDGIDVATDVAANTAKTSNVTHTGEITGSGILTAQPSVIGNRAPVTAASGDMILIQDASDSNLLKKIDAADFLATAGDVVGPATATDNAVARYDATTGKLIQDSSVSIDDAANLSGVNNITVSGTVDGIDVATDVTANTAKVTNATHSGEMTGAGALTAQPAIIANRSTVTAATGDLILIRDATDSTLKNVDVSDLLGGDVDGPSGATNNAIARYDTATGKLIQDSAITIDDSANLA